MADPVRPHDVGDLAARIRPQTPRGAGLANAVRAPAQQNFTADGAIEWLLHFVAAIHKTPRLPINVTSTREADGSLTIRAVPIH